MADLVTVPEIATATETVLEVRDLSTAFTSGRHEHRVVDRVSLSLRRGRTTAIVGESGSGKTVTALSLLQLIEPPGRVVGGEILYRGQDLRRLNERQMQAIRGARIGMVFQDPLTSLNPSLRIGTQIAETLRAHETLSRAAAERRAAELLARVGVPDAAARARDFPHQFSGGMRQRVLIAMAIACGPEIIIADEPTTALDVTVQAKILRLLHDLQQETGASLLMITHDLGVVAVLADEVAVMYAGRVVERADVDTLFHAPQHPYTKALLACAISLEDDRHSQIVPIAGAPPDLRRRPPGCPFAPRCPVAVAKCRTLDPPLLPVLAGQEVACFVAQEAVHA
ncbi:MAG: ABC transporter ATP-binding protein [Pseudomonadota bacterium]|nr:ABC transporter ATP-binding protein [Pseudomonadota bacterium]